MGRNWRFQFPKIPVGRDGLLRERSRFAYECARILFGSAKIWLAIVRNSCASVRDPCAIARESCAEARKICVRLCGIHGRLCACPLLLCRNWRFQFRGIPAGRDGILKCYVKRKSAVTNVDFYCGLRTWFPNGWLKSGPIRYLPKTTGPIRSELLTTG